MIKKVLLTGAMLICLTGCVTRQIPEANIPETTQEPNTTEKSTQQETTTENVTTTEVEKETTTEEPATDEPDENLNLMQQVLLNQAYFTDIKYARNTFAISELGEVSDYAYFHYIDLDGDGSKEVWLNGYPDGSASIFTIRDGEVYRYPDSSRNDFFADGTYYAGAGAAYTIFCRISEFMPKATDELLDGCMVDYIAIHDGAEPNNLFYSDIIDGKFANEITEQEYNDIMSQYERIPAEKYDFTEENIKKIITQ